jgi:hypothetical protein
MTSVLIPQRMCSSGHKQRKPRSGGYPIRARSQRTGSCTLPPTAWWRVSCPVESEANDGYLSGSEIATLKLDADWVILSACNTAAGGAQGAEALEGLARAFFYAGARSLLVSHWEVASDSTVKLITKAVAELKADPKVGRAEALRRSMLSMITTSKDYEAHPAFWAPFVFVGEGGAASVCLLHQQTIHTP